MAAIGEPLPGPGSSVLAYSANWAKVGPAREFQLIKESQSGEIKLEKSSYRITERDSKVTKELEMMFSEDLEPDNSRANDVQSPSLLIMINLLQIFLVYF